MEPRGHYVLVGAFVLSVFIGLAGFIMWLVGSQDNRHNQRHAIYFQESVTGLAEGGVVRYRGIEVGRVARMLIDPGNSEQILVLVDIREGTPIKVDTTATLKFQGVTGVAYIELKGGSTTAALLEIKEGQEYPVITSEESDLGKVFNSVPDMIENFSDVAVRASILLSDQNIQSASQAMQNLQAFTQVLADRQQEINTVLQNTSKAVEHLGAAAETINKVAGTVDQNLGGTLQQIREASTRFGALSAELEGLVKENRKQVSGTALNDMSKLVRETRDTAKEIQSLAKELRQQPSSVVFGTQETGRKVAQ